MSSRPLAYRQGCSGIDAPSGRTLKEAALPLAHEQVLFPDASRFPEHDDDTWPDAAVDSNAVRFELTGIASEALRATHTHRETLTRSAPVELARQQALEAMLHELLPEDRVAFVHGLVKNTQGHLHYRMDVVCRTTHPDLEGARKRLDALKANVCTALAAGAQEFIFGPATQRSDIEEPPHPCRVQLLPHGLAVRDPSSPAMQANSCTPSEARLALPLAPITSLFWSSNLMAMLSSIGSPCKVVIEFAGRSFDAPEFAAIVETAQSLLDLPSRSVVVTGKDGAIGIATQTQVQIAYAMLQNWSTHPCGADVRVIVQGAHTLPRSLVRLVGRELLGGRSFDAIDADQVSVSPTPNQLSSYLPSGAMLPPLLPDAQTAVRLGCSRSLPRVGLPASNGSTVLGRALTPYGDMVVRLPDSDREQSCYVLGRSGTGKSTYLAGRICQDIERGDGVVVVDPHGDLYDHLLRSIPSRRKQDVVLVDFTDFDHCPGLNLLQRTGRYPDLERNFIIRTISQIFQKLYAQVPESMGPMFQLYMRSAVALAMEDPDGCATLMDVPRLLSDDLYRDYLLSQCRDRDLRDFWIGIAHRVGGDHELKNLVPWIINKFTEFTDNALVRQVVGQPQSTIDFRSTMDERKIVLVNLSKQLGDLDSQFLGMLLTSRLLAAALSRADVAPEARTRCHVYIDEFHNLTTLSSVEALLAESRKYGVTLTIAHQNLAQLPDRTAQTVMANTGSFVFFRLGPQDADALAPYVGAHFGADDLAALPDHHAVMQMKMFNAPCTSFLVRTEMPTPPPTAACTDPEELKDLSRRGYCTPAADVRRHLDARRYAYVGRLKPIEIGLSTQLLQALVDGRIGTLGDLQGWSREARIGLAKAASTARDRRVLRQVEAFAASMVTTA